MKGKNANNVCSYFMEGRVKNKGSKYETSNIERKPPPRLELTEQ